MNVPSRSTGKHSLWASMIQGGEEHLQCTCGEFDSHLVHHNAEIAQLVERQFEALVAVVRFHVSAQR